MGTVTLLQRRGKNLRTRHIDDLREAVRARQGSLPVIIRGREELPDHRHGVRDLPPGYSDFALRWRWFNGRTVQS
ncbi:hypothetical protein CEK28_10395 [Xenophilus sp. AP218F]|nr:hypothetical protein CEK28_10395 [Xenophilus sp. AP218F]